MLTNCCKFNCNGRLISGIATYTAKVDDIYVRINNAPAFVCEECGEIIYDYEVDMRIRKYIEDFAKSVPNVVTIEANWDSINSETKVVELQHGDELPITGTLKFEPKQGYKIDWSKVNNIRQLVEILQILDIIIWDKTLAEKIKDYVIPINQ